MNKIVAWIIGKIGVSALVAIIQVLYVAVIVAFFAFIMNAIRSFREIVLQLLNLISNNPTDGNFEYISMMYGYLDAIGFLSAWATSWPLIESAIIFLIVRIVWKYAMNAYKEFVTSVHHIASTL